MRREAQALAEWPRSAQQVTLAWSAWLAAETRDRSVRYSAFVAALAGEESAAVGLERVIDLAEGDHRVSEVDGQTSGLGAR